MLTAIVLVKNEEIHIARCLDNLLKTGCKVKLVDSGSTDSTLTIAQKYPNVEVYSNPWVNYATQFNWAILNCGVDTEWVLRIDADEYFDDDLIDYLNHSLKLVPDGVNGIYVRRSLVFMGQKISHGSGKVYHLKIWRRGFASCENKWMDEHMILTGGESLKIESCLIDHNLKSVTDFLTKHNGYATREAIDYFENYSPSALNSQGIGSAPTHAVKSFYYKNKIFLRCFLFYFYAMTFRRGFMDGVRGFVYHTLQKLIYRLFVDIKIYEARFHESETGELATEFLKRTK